MVDEVIAVGDERFQRKCFRATFSRCAAAAPPSSSWPLHFPSLEDVLRRWCQLDSGQVQARGLPRGRAGSTWLTSTPGGRQEGESLLQRFRTARQRRDPVTDVTWSVDDGPFERASVVAGQRVTFRIEYEAMRDLENAVFGLGFVNESGISVAGAQLRNHQELVRSSGVLGPCTSRWTGCSCNLRSSGSLPLLWTGHMSSTTSIGRTSSGQISGSDEPGLVQMPGTWELVPAGERMHR